MSQGIWLTIGLNNVNASSYPPGTIIPPLEGCENDATSIAQLLSGLSGYDRSASSTLLSSQATRGAVLGFISNAASKLQPGDLFVLHYSGHGMQGGVDSTGQPVPSSTDTTCWVLFDGPLASDQLFQGWFAFQTGVRILVLSDSCFSGSAVKQIGLNRKPFLDKGLHPADSFQIVRQDPGFFKQFADARSTRAAAAAPQVPNPAVLLISGCQSTETSLDTVDNKGTPHGLFTAVLLEVFNSGFNGTYDDFSKALQQATNQQSLQIDPGHTQNPNEFPVGNFVDVANFMQSSPPFTV